MGSHDELRDFFDALAPRFDENKARHRVYYAEQTAILKHLVLPGQRVLEIGAGTGDTLAALRPSVGVGIDVSPEMVKRAREKHPGLRFEVMDADALDLGGETFDVVLLVDLVGELRDLWQTFRKLRDVVHSETRVVITYYNFLWQPLIEAAQALGLKRDQLLQNWFSLEDVENLLTLNGFEKVREGDRLLVPVQVPVVTNAVNRLAQALPGVHDLNLIQFLVARPGPTFDVTAKPMTTTVVVPAKNERGNVRDAIRRTPLMGQATEIIFVEGGSSDGTREEILRAIEDEPSPCTKRFLPQTGKGKKNAVEIGFAAAKHEALMILDADLTVMPEDLPRFHLALSEGRGEFINGCRLIYQLEDQAMRHLNLIANKAFGVAFSYVLDQRIKDTLCGTKVLTKKSWDRISSTKDVLGDFDPFGDFDLLFGAARLGLKIVEIPVRYKARVYGSTQIHRFQHGLMLARMLGVAIRHFKMS